MDDNFIVTIGPNSWDKNSICAFTKKGVNTIRFPFSKENPEHHCKKALMVRNISEKLNKKNFDYA